MPARPRLALTPRRHRLGGWREAFARTCQAAAALCVVGGTSAGGTILHVDPAAAPGGDGTAENPLRTIAEGLARVAPGDELRLAAGVYRETMPVLVNGIQRAAVLPLPDGVQVQGSGRGLTVLEAPPGAAGTYGITAEGAAAGAAVRDLTVRGPCFQGVNLRGASPVLERVEVHTDAVGGSSTAVDVRDGSFPRFIDCDLDGGHSAVFVEFGSGGTFDRCRLGSRQNETLAVIDSAPTLRQCVIEAGGRDTIVLAQGSQPVLLGCALGRGARWTVRVAGGYQAGALVDLSGNLWGTRDPGSIATSILDAQDEPQLGARVEFLPLGDAVVTPAISIGALKRR